MPQLESPEGGRRRWPAFAKVELREAWEAVQQVQRLGAPGLGLAAESLRAKLPFLQPRSSPDRSRLSSVESFFKYTEEEGAWPPRAAGAGEQRHGRGRAAWGRLAHAPRLRAGKRFFEELDRDNDGRVKLEDLKICMRCAPERSFSLCACRIAAERARRAPLQAPQAAGALRKRVHAARKARLVRRQHWVGGVCGADARARVLHPQGVQLAAA